MKQQIPFKKFKTMCVVNSKELDTVIIKGELYDWVGVGLGWFL